MIRIFILQFFTVANFAIGQNPDYQILKAINSGENAAWDNFMRATSKSVYYVWPATIVVPVVDGYWNKDKSKYRSAIKSALSIGIASGTSGLMKISFMRTRPFVKYPNIIIQRDHAGPNSFPSGHTTTAFASATVISLTYNKWYLTVPAYVYAGLVGYSRMRLGMHYPTDVLTGILIGTGAPLLVWKVDKYLVEKKEKRKQPVGY